MAIDQVAWRKGIADVYAEYAQRAASSGRLAVARESLQEAIRVSDCISADFPDDSDVIGARLLYRAKMTGLDVLAGDFRAANSMAVELSDLMDSASVLSPKDFDDSEWTTYVQVINGDVAILAGRTTEALGAYRNVAGALSTDRSNDAMPRGRKLSSKFDDWAGGTALQMGDVDAAQEHYAASLSKRQEDLAHDPQCRECMLSLGQSYAQVGDVAMQLGDMIRARQAFERGVALVSGIAKSSDLDSEDLARLVGRSARLFTRLGRVLASLGEDDISKEYLREARALLEPLEKRFAADTSLSGSIALADYHEYLGEIALDQGDFDTSRRHLSNALKVREDLARDADEVSPLVRLVAESHEYLGSLELLDGHSEEADVQFRASEDIRRRGLSAAHQDDGSRCLDMLNVTLLLADSAFDQGDVDRYLRQRMLASILINAWKERHGQDLWTTRMIEKVGDYQRKTEVAGRSIRCVLPDFLKDGGFGAVIDRFLGLSLLSVDSLRKFGSDCGLATPAVKAATGG